MSRDPESNARLTSLAGMTLFVLLAVQGVTILRIHRLLTLHFVVGFVLLGPLALKLGSTGYRFLRYYSGDQAYGDAGPPRPLLRVTASFLVACTAGVFGTGVALAFAKRGQERTVLFLHKAFFVLWFALTTVHVLAYLGRAGRLSAAELRGHGPPVVLTRRSSRAVAIGASVVAGLGLGVLALGWAHAWSATGPRR